MGLDHVTTARKADGLERRLFVNFEFSFFLPPDAEYFYFLTLRSCLLVSYHAEYCSRSLYMTSNPLRFGFAYDVDAARSERYRVRLVKQIYR